jgi:hypothetical protein
MLADPIATPTRLTKAQRRRGLGTVCPAVVKSLVCETSRMILV